MLFRSDAARIAAGITDEYLEEAEKGHLREVDYTQKRQKSAAVEKLMDANPGMNWEDAAKSYEWQKTQWPGWQQEHQRLEAQIRANDTRREETPPARVESKKGRWSSRLKAEDFYETERLRENFADLEDELSTSIGETVLKRVNDEWYEKTIAPRWERAAGGYTQTVINLLRAIWPDRKSTRLNSSHIQKSRMPSSA